METQCCGCGRLTTESTDDWPKTLAPIRSTRRPSSPLKIAAPTVTYHSREFLHPWVIKGAGRLRPNPPGPTQVLELSQKAFSLHPTPHQTGKTSFSPGTGQLFSSTSGVTTAGTTPTGPPTDRSWRPPGPSCSPQISPLTPGGRIRWGWG